MGGAASSGQRRFLFSFAGGAGHFLPLLPLARFLAADGHTVAFAAQATMLPMVEAAGFAGFDAGGPTTRDATMRGPLLKLDMEREYRTYGTVTRAGWRDDARAPCWRARGHGSPT